MLPRLPTTPGGSASATRPTASPRRSARPTAIAVLLLLAAVAVQAQPSVGAVQSEWLAAHVTRSAPRAPGPDGLEGLRMEAPGPDTLRAAPGGTVGFGVRFSEEAGRARTLAVGVEVPGRWQALLTRPSLRLAPGASALQLVNVRVAADAMAGDYPIHVRVGTGGGAETVVRKVVSVEAVQAVSVLVVGTPRFVAAGEAYTATAIVSNEGNAPIDVWVEAISTQRYRVDPAEAALQVPLGGAVELPLHVQTVARPGSVEDRLIVRVRSGIDGAQVAEGASVVDVLPLRGAPTTARSWPLVGSVSAVGVGTSVVPRVGLVGVVPLDREQTRRITLDLSDAGGRSESIYAQRTEWQVRYAGPGASARAGTGTYHLSPTTSHAMYGVGGEVQVEGSRADLTAQVRRPLLGRVTYEPGLTVGVAAGARSAFGRLSLTALAGSGGLGGRVVTGRIESSALPGFDVDAEAGAVEQGERPVYTVRASTGLGRLRVSAQVRRADQYQPGRYTSLASRGISGHVVLSRHVAGRVEWQETTQGTGRDGILLPSSNGLALAAVDAQVPVGPFRLTTGASATRRRSAREGQFDQTVDELSARLGAAWKGVYGTVEGGGGRATFALLDTTRPTWLGRASVGASGRWGEVSAHVDGTEGSSVWADRPTRQWSGGLSASVRGPGLDLTGSVSRGLYEVGGVDDILPLRDATQTLRLETTVGVPGGQQVVLGLADYRSQTFRATHAQATLRVPIPVPLPYALDLPRVRGRFVDAVSGEGIQGIVVSLNGDQVVTDRDGSFEFMTGPDGGFLTIDRASLGVGRVPRVELPLHVTPEAPVTIEVARRTALRGAIRLVTILGTGARADTSDAGGVRRAVVEVEGEGQRVRTVTDDDGRFLFDDLPQGDYALRVVRAWLPERHRLEHETLRVSTAEASEVLWRVVPSVREMQILRGGTLRTGSTVGGGTPLTVRPDSEVSAAPMAEPTAPVTPRASTPEEPSSSGPERRF